MGLIEELVLPAPSPSMTGCAFSIEDVQDNMRQLVMLAREDDN